MTLSPDKFQKRIDRKRIFLRGMFFSRNSNYLLFALAVLSILALSSLTLEQLPTAEAIGKTPSSTFTDAKVEEFSASASEKGVIVEWQSSYEIDNLGYRVWREQGGERTAVNKELIAGSVLQVGSGIALPAGKGYRITDQQASKESLTTVSYWLEDVDVNGISSWHGPVAVSESKETAENERQSPTFEQLQPIQSNQAEKTVAPTEKTSSSQEIKVSKSQSSVPALNAVTNALPQDNKAVKIEIANDGWAQVSRTELEQAGFNVNSSSVLWQLFVGGQEIPIRINADSSIEFYAQASRNHQTAGQIYWLTIGTTSGKRLSETRSALDNSAQVGIFNQKSEYTNPTMRVSSILNGADENFYSAVIGNFATTINLDLQQIATESTSTAQVMVKLQGLTLNGLHQVEVKLNNVSLGTLDYYYQDRQTFTANVPLGSLREGTNTVTVMDLMTRSYSLVETVCITYPRRTVAPQNRLTFPINVRQKFRVNGLTSNAVRVVDVTNPVNPAILKTDIVRQSNGSYSLSIPAALKTRTIRLEPTTDIVRAQSLKLNQPSNLQSTSNQADFVIIGPGEYAAAAEILRQKRQAEGLKSMFVPVEEIYDEFSSGERSPLAIKAFFNKAYTTWSVKPRYALLLGHATVDPRNFTGYGGANLDQVPTVLYDSLFMEASGDEALADFNGDGISEITIGRMPVTSAAEAQAVIQKSIRAENNSSGWASRTSALVNDSPTDYPFDVAISEVRPMIPTMMPVQSISRTDGDVTTVHNRIMDVFNNGAMLVHYFGHGSNNAWTSGNIFNSNDALAMTNSDRMPLLLATTCLNGTHAEIGVTSMAEAFVKAPNGGARGVFASSTLVDADAQRIMFQVIYQKLFTNNAANRVRIGDALQQSKLSMTDYDVRVSYTYFGDPTSPFVVNN